MKNKIGKQHAVIQLVILAIVCALTYIAMIDWYSKEFMMSAAIINSMLLTVPNLLILKIRINSHEKQNR